MATTAMVTDDDPRYRMLDGRLNLCETNLPQPYAEDARLSVRRPRTKVSPPPLFSLHYYRHVRREMEIEKEMLCGGLLKDAAKHQPKTKQKNSKAALPPPPPPHTSITRTVPPLCVRA